MSTAERYGNEVWAGARAVQKHQACKGQSDFTVGQVAQHTGMSKSTVRKYLKMLVESGYVSAYVTPHGHWVYSVRREYRLGLGEV